MMQNNSYYGGYRTRTFQEIWNSSEEFLSFLTTCDVPLKITEQSAETLYYLLYARFGNSHIASSDENQFRYQIASTIFMYGPTWEKRLEVQDNLRKLSLDELRIGSKSIYNSALNPGTAPTTSTLDELPAINSQNTSNKKKSVVAAYADLWELLKTDVSKKFIEQFKAYFIKVLEPDYPLLYKFNVEGE